MKFNEKLQKTRISKGFTQSQLAEKLSVHYRTYQNYELGTREPKINTILELSYILDISLDDLLCLDDYILSRES